MEFVVGKDYRTRGGWRARCIWIPGAVEVRAGTVLRAVGGGYFIHTPNLSEPSMINLNEESPPIWHHPDGRAVAALSVNEPPTYGVHPADLVDVWKEE